MLEKLEKNLGYTFKNLDLLKHALAHRSYGKKNNERLEFLGDAILNLIIAEKLFHRFPDSVEGDLSRLRANLVRGETLSKVSLDLDVGPFLLLGPGEMKSGGERRASILADALEAIIAAVYMDSGLDTCAERVLVWFGAELSQISPDKIEKDPKSTLQELLQAKQLPLPQYDLIETTGKEHQQEFKVTCKTAILNYDVFGVGPTRRKAEQQAAANVLTELSDD